MRASFKLCILAPPPSPLSIGITFQFDGTPCALQRNSATLNGGGIFRTQGSGEVSLCLFQNNTATKLGGALYDVQVPRFPTVAVNWCHWQGCRPLGVKNQ